MAAQASTARSVRLGAAGAMSAPYALKVVHGRDTVELSVAPETTIRELKAQLQERCGAPARNMRLIFRGKTLEDAASLSGAGLTDGARLMLLAGGAPVVSAARPRSCRKTRRR